MNVYDSCPVYETESFRLRLVEPSDAEALLACYSDPNAVCFINADRCTSDFYYRTVEEMRNCIAFWLSAYRDSAYVRFAVVTKNADKAVGTVEMFGGNGPKEYADWGMLRVDVAAVYETEKFLCELIGLACEKFYEAFCVRNIVTKAIAEAQERRAALAQYGFSDMAESCVPFDRPRKDYFIRPSRQVGY